MKDNYLERILTARVYDVAKESPLELAPRLSARLNNRVLLKREDLQPVFSFKLRGAYNKMVQLPPEVRARGVITASAGNHAQGVALAASKLGIKALIVMPRTAPGIKVKAPRVVEAPISMECRVVQMLPVGHGPHSLVLGEIVYFHIRDDLYNPATGRIDMHRLHPVGRLAGNLYTHEHDIFEMKRPVENYAG